MSSRSSRLVVLFALVATAALGVVRAEAGQMNSSDLFYNYYVPPDNSGVGAELYVSPRPAPAMVGHTWITYQPLMPHQFLYTHKRHYVRQNPGAGVTITKVRYGHRCLQAIVPTWMDGKILSHIFVNPCKCDGQYYCP
ncbi:MAG TPA: hypothetical protein DD670_07765 [Planctomycetaceae bacterium]|nr:hypothetical protein [Planctomycetaceae bacterium]